MSETVDLAVLSIGIDSSAVKKGSENLAGLKKDAEKTESATEKLGEEFAKAMKKVEDLNEALAGVKSATDEVKKLSDVGAKLSKAFTGAGLEKISADVKNAGATLGGFSAEVQKVFTRLRADTDRLSGGFGNLAREEERAFSRIREEASKLSREFSAIHPNASKAANGIKDAGSASASAADDTSKLTANLKQAVAGLVGFATVTKVLGDSTKAALQFRTEMKALSTLLEGEQVKSLGELEGKLRALGPAMGNAAPEQAKGLFEIISAGASDSATALEYLTISNKLAVGGITEVAVAADGITSTMASYGSQIAGATEASDAFFVAAADGKTTIEDLSRHIGKVAPIASQVGVSLDELLASTAALTKAGIRTETAMEGMRAILAQVLKPSEEASKLAKLLGLDFSAAALKAKGLAGFLEDLKEKTGGSKEQMAFLLGGVEAILPVMTLTGSAAGDFANSLENMSSKAGKTEEAFQKMADNPQFRLDQLNAKIKDLEITIGDGLLQAIDPVTASLVKNFDSVAKALGFAAQAAGVLVAAKLAGWAQQGITALLAKEAALTKTRNSTIAAALAEADYKRAAGESSRAALNSAMALLKEREAALMTALALEGPLAGGHTTAALAATRMTQAQVSAAMATANVTVASRAAGAALAFMGGPIGFVITALGVAAMAFSSYSNEADEAREEMGRWASSTGGAASEARQLTDEIRKLEEAASATTATVKEQERANTSIQITMAKLKALGPEYRAALEGEIYTWEQLHGAITKVNQAKLTELDIKIAKLKEEKEKVDASFFDWVKQATFGDAKSKAEVIAEKRAPYEETLNTLLRERARIEESLLQVEERAAQKEEERAKTHAAKKFKDPKEMIKEAEEREKAADRAANARENDLKSLEKWVLKLEEEARMSTVAKEAAYQLTDEYLKLDAAQKARADSAMAAINAAKAQADADKKAAQAAEEAARKQKQHGEELDRMALQLDPLKNARAEMEKLNELYATGRISLQLYETEARKLAKTMNTGFTQVMEVVDIAAGHMEEAFVHFATTGELQVKEMIDGIIKDVIRLLAHKAILALVDLLSSAFIGGSTGGVGGFGAMSQASGGFGRAGQPLIVGERGPELFVPHASGTTVPNDALMGGGGTEINVNVQVNADGSSKVEATGGDSNAESLKLARQIGDAVKKTLADETRSGGIIYNFVKAR